VTPTGRLCVAVAGLVLAGAALAHAMLDRASPAVGSRVAASPARVELWFTEALEPTFSSVKVLDAGGRQVDRRDAAFDTRTPGHVSVSLPTLAPGRYRVVWRAVSVDTHATSGDYAFDVAP
jgi:methionine-rich copper-binding protein CopC